MVEDETLFFELGDFAGDSFAGETGQGGELGMGNLLGGAEAAGVENEVGNRLVIGVAGQEGLDAQEMALETDVNTLQEIKDDIGVSMQKS